MVIDEGSYFNHGSDNYRAALLGRVPDEYFDVTLEPWYAGTSNQNYRLYRGATPSARVNGMFSFFPCAPFATHAAGFARPLLKLESVVSERLKQGKKITPSTLATSTKAWFEIAEQVLAQGLLLGVKAELPSLRTQ